MEPNWQVLGTIKNVNFLEGSTKKVKEPTIGEMLGELEQDQEVMADTITNVCSIGKQKEGKINLTKPSLASKAVAKEKNAREKKNSKKDKKEEPKGKSKLALKSGLGPSKKTIPAAKEPRTSPRKQPAIPMLKQNPQINPETGASYTMPAEKEVIQRLLEGRSKRKATPEKESSSSK